MSIDSPTVRPRSRSYAGFAEEHIHASRQLLPDRQVAMHAIARPNAPALRHEDGRQLTYAELDKLVARLASGLRALGLEPGDALGIRLPNCPEYLALVLASARAGLVYAPINQRLAQPEVDFMIDEGGLRLVVGEHDIPVETVLAAAQQGPLGVELDETMPFHLRYSSGTTGRQKVSVGTQRTIALLNLLLGRELGLHRGDVQLAVAPLTHMAGSLALAQLAAGGLVLIRTGFDADTLWSECDEHGATNLAVVPTIIASAIDAPGRGDTLRGLISMGAPLAVSLKQRIAQRFPALGLYEMYGASELGLVTCLRPDEQLLKPASVGRAAFGYELMVADDEGVPLPAGEVGDVYARGPMVHSGYVGQTRPQPPPAALEGTGWITVGDLGHLDEDGFLYLSARRSDLILSGGFNVYPAEIEKVIIAIEGVREVAVVGVDDERWGQRVVACVVGQASEQAIAERCRAELAGYKQPREYVFMEQLPKSPNGKLAARELRELLSARQPGSSTRT